MHEENISVLVYETSTYINWKEFINTNFNTELPLTTLTNSYLLLFNIDNDVYAITAGRANNIIDSYKDKTFGLRIMTKLFNEDDPVIKKNVESYVNEPKTSGSSTYRGSNSFFDETIVTSIKRNMDIETNPDILEKMGIIERDKDGSLDDKVLSIKFGNNIEISKRLSFSEMKRIVNKIHNIDKNEEVLFALDNISLPEKYNIKQNDIKERLKAIIKLDEYLNKLYIPYNGNYNIENMYLYNGLKRIGEDKFNDIKTYPDLTNYVKDKLKSSVSFLDYSLIDETEGDIKVKLYDHLEISIEFNEREFFLIGGSFYTFDNNYSEFYDNRYRSFVSKSNAFINSNSLITTIYKDIKDYCKSQV